MSRKTPAAYLRDMLAELADIIAFTKEGQSAFMNDKKTRKAVIRSYEVMGEIAKRMPETLRQANPQINWRQLGGFRDFLAHNYETVLLDRIWEAVEDAPNLYHRLEVLLDHISEED